jgi:hypothetical protein
MEHYLAADKYKIRANVVYNKIHNNYVGSFFGYEGHGCVADSIFLIDRRKKLHLDFDIYKFPKTVHKDILRIEKFRSKFESRTSLGSLSKIGKKLKESLDTEVFDGHWEYGTEDFDLNILKKLSSKWSLLIHW